MTVKTSLFDVRLERYRPLMHVLFWAAMICYDIFVWGTVDGGYAQRCVMAFVDLPIKLMAAYFTLYVLIDRYFLQGKNTQFVVYLVLSMIFFGVMSRILAYNIIYPMYYPDATHVPLIYLPKILITIFSIYSLVAILACVHLIRHGYRTQQTAQQLQQAKQQLEKEMLEANLKFLKSQINPHFLFNTLNNLYVLALNRAEKTPEVIYKLSELMSYMLYEGNRPEVPLEREIQYIQNYITLEKIRYGARLDVSFNVYDNVQDVHIAPLVILPFIENSFKHGVSNQLAGGWIRIDISRQDTVLAIKVENSRVVKETPSQPNPMSGIGLQNVRKRLDLIYANRYQLEIHDEEETYLVVLKLELDTEKVIARSEATKPEIENSVDYEVSYSR